MTDSNLKKAWLSLSPDANEEQIAWNLVIPEILAILGFQKDEIYPEYFTGKGNQKVDIAARKNTKNDNFSHTKNNASLIVELKKRKLDLRSSNNPYKSAVKQLKGYLHPVSVNCQKANWGILTNANQIQLFRRHGRVIYPQTTNIELNANNIDEKIAIIKNFINNQTRALLITLYNNKGGVGKTTTTINLAGVLSLPKPLGFGKKVLVVDFDPNQKDLSDLLELPASNLSLFDFYKDRKNLKITDVITQYRFKEKFGFDVIPADDKFLKATGTELASITKGTLLQALLPLKNLYDYILIDSPPGDSYFTHEALTAADVVLMPSKHNGVASFKNAAMAMKTIFPALGEARRAYAPELADPTPLPIFFNGESITRASKEQAQNAIKAIIQQAKQEDKIDLMHFFFPRWTSEQKDLEIFQMPSYAHIASAAFANRPAVFNSKVACEYYRNLVQEYFI